MVIFHILTQLMKSREFSRISHDNAQTTQLFQSKAQLLKVTNTNLYEMLI